MAEIDTFGGGGKKGGKVRSKKASTRIDLTAMVDLAFLLITFFIMATSLAKPKAMSLAMPIPESPPEPVSDLTTMSICLGKGNKVMWYMGMPEKPLTTPKIVDFSK